MTCLIQKITPIEIPEEDPFHNDKLDRSRTAELLTNIVSNNKQPIVICLNAQWGDGKTTFLKMWKQYVKNQGFFTVYFNAWESDFFETATVALYGEIWKIITEYMKDPVAAVVDGKKTLKNIGRKLIKAGTSFTEYQARKYLGDSTVEITKEIASLIEVEHKDVPELLTSFVKSKNEMCSFKAALNELSEFLGIQKDGSSKPVIFIIDELDRCKPDFSIELLEAAKHLFNAKNITFVLGVDRHHLGESIKTKFGSNMDVDGYLRRFIDLDLSLPTITDPIFHANYLFEKYDISNIVDELSYEETFLSWTIDDNFEGFYLDMSDGIKNIFGVLFCILNMSIREREYCCSFFRLILSSTINSRDYLGVIAFLCLIKIKLPQEYKKILNRTEDVLTILDSILKGKNNKFPLKEDHELTFFDTPMGLFIKTLLIFSDTYGNDRSQKVKSLEKLFINGSLGWKLVRTDNDTCVLTLKSMKSARQNCVSNADYCFFNYLSRFDLGNILDKIDLVASIIPANITEEEIF